MSDPFASVAKPLENEADPFASVAQPIHPDGPQETEARTAPGYVAPSKYQSFIEASAKRNNVDVKVIRSIHQIEDPSEDPKIVSSAGAVGEMQLEPGTFAEVADKGASITDPAANIEAGTRYLAKLTKMFNGDMHKVFAAYNAGPYAGPKALAAAQDYAKRAEANIAYLTQSLEPAKSRLSKGTASKVIRPSVARPVAPPPTRTEEDENAADKVTNALNAGAATLYNVPGAVASSGYKALPPDAQKKVADLMKSGPVQGTATTARFVNSVSDLPIEFLNAAMRDMAMGNATEEGKFGQVLWEGLQHPQAMGDMLDLLGKHYGVNRKEELLFWMRQPGVREMVSGGSPKTKEGGALQFMAAVHADYARGLITHEGLRDFMTVAEEFVNPGNAVPGLFLKTAGFLTKLGAKGVGKVIDRVPNARGPVDKVNKATKQVADAAYTIMPMGDKFHMTKVKAGAVEAGKHFNLANNIAKVPEQMGSLFGQENKLGNTSRAQRVAIWREHDLFYNVHESAHLFQPTGGDPFFDPLTRTTVMQKGGLYNRSLPEHYQHVFVAHGGPRLEIRKGSEAETILGPRANDWSDHITNGRYSEALQLHPGIGKAEADKFERDIKANPAATNTKAGKAWMKNQATIRLLGEHARQSGIEAINWDDQVVFGAAQRALKRDLTDINGTSLHDRAYYTAQGVNFIDGGLHMAAPSVAKKLLDGYLARSGMFKEEPTFEERFALERTGKKQAKQGGTGVEPGPPKRHYKSIREAEAAPPLGGGLVEDPQFEPGAALMKAMTRSVRFQHFARYLTGYAKPINYEMAAANSGVAWTVPARFINPSGKLGRGEFDGLVTKEAEARVKLKLTQPQFDALSDGASKPVLDDMVKKEAAVIYRQVEDAWKTAHPGMTWDTANETLLEDLVGTTVPTWARDAAFDSHPAFENTQDRSLGTMLAHEDQPDNQLFNAFDSVMHMMRTAFLADPTYHPRQNILPIALMVGHLNPAEIGQILIAPNTIDPKILEEAEKYGATSPGFGAGVGGAKTRARYMLSSREAQTDHNLFRRNSPPALAQRIKDTLSAYKNSVDGATGWRIPQHILGRAAYQADKWNQDLTFKVWEDTTAALIHHKLVKKGMDPWVAGRETRKQMGDTLNITKMERQLGLQRFEWFYSWFKTQMRLWAKNVANPRVIAVNNAITDTLQSHNENDPSVDNPTRLADRGQAVFHLADGTPYRITVAPPFTRKLGAINALASTPWTQGQGAMDFATFMASDLAHSLNPAMKTLFEEIPATFGGPAARTETIGDVGAQALSGGIATVLPPQTTAIAHGMKDPVRYLELLGVPVVKLNNSTEVIGINAMLKKLQAREGKELMMAQQAGNQSMAAAIKERYREPIQELLRQQQELYGR